MEKPTQPANLAKLLSSQTRTMTPDELKRFRDELARRIPEVVRDAAQAARGRPVVTEK